jgi:hypothetical protein
MEDRIGVLVFVLVETRTLLATLANVQATTKNRVTGIVEMTSGETFRKDMFEPA